MQDGKPVFIGREDPTNTPIRLPAECVHGSVDCSHMECPVCHNYFDYLVGENTNDGGRMGCDGCYRPGKSEQTNESYDPSKEIL